MFKRFFLSFAVLTAASVSCFATEPENDAPVTTLKQAMSVAYNKNPDIKSAIQNLEATNETISQAISGWLPSASAGVDYGKQQTTFGNSPKKKSTVENKSLSASQPIFKGENIPLYNQAENLILASRYNLQSTEQKVLLETATAYVNLITDQSLLGLAESRVKILEKQLEDTQIRFELGTLTKTDVAQAEARLSLVTAKKIEAESSLANSRANFEKVVGETAGALQIPDDIPNLPKTLDEALAKAQEKNPVANAAKYSEKAADEGVDVNIGSLLPKVSLDASASRQKENNFTGSSFDEDSVMLSLKVPLYQSGSEYSKVRQAKKQASAKKYEYMSVTRQVAEQVKTIWQQVTSANAAIIANVKAVEAAQLALEGVRLESENGSRSVIEVLDAEQELFDAKTALLNSKRNQVVAYYSLLDSIGTLTARDLGLGIKTYDAEAEYDKTKFKIIGF